MNNDDAERAQQEAAARDLVAVLTAQFWTVINDPAAQWAREPHAVAHALAGTLLQVLIALTISDPEDVGYGMKLIADVEQQFVQRTAAPTTQH